MVEEQDPKMVKCPKCKHVFETEEERDELDREARDKRHGEFFHLFIANFILLSFPLGFLLDYLDKKFILGWSIETGVALNYYLFPMMIIGCFYGIYCILYGHKKVKGSFFIIKPTK